MENKECLLIPKVFIDMNECFIGKLYSKYSGFSKFKGYIVSACDGSIVDLPIVTLTREEFPVGDENLLKEKKNSCKIFMLFRCVFQRYFNSKNC